MPVWSDAAGQGESHHAEPPKNRSTMPAYQKLVRSPSDSPRFQRSHNSVFSAAVKPTRLTRTGPQQVVGLNTNLIPLPCLVLTFELLRSGGIELRRAPAVRQRGSSR